MINNYIIIFIKCSRRTNAWYISNLQLKACRVFETSLALSSIHPPMFSYTCSIHSPSIEKQSTDTPKIISLRRTRSLRNHPKSGWQKWLEITISLTQIRKSFRKYNKLDYRTVLMWYQENKMWKLLTILVDFWERIGQLQCRKVSLQTSYDTDGWITTAFE